MAKVQNKIWRCPLCRVGIRAPSRIRKTDAKRYCLPCTKDTGKLVERMCVAREAKKQKVSDRTKEALERAKKVVEMELKLYPWVLYPWFNDFCKLKAWDQPDRFDGTQFKISRGRHPNSTWAYSSTNKIIHVSAGTNPHEALGAMLWGMAGFSSSAGEEHLASFLRAVVEVCKLNYGIACLESSESWYAGLKVLEENFTFPTTSTRMTMPVPKRRKKRAHKKQPKKSKVQKAILQRSKKAEW